MDFSSFVVLISLYPCLVASQSSSSVFVELLLCLRYVVCCPSFSCFFTLVLSLIPVFHVVSVLLTLSLYPSRKRWDLDLSSSPYLFNPRRLSPSCSNQDPFSPVCVFMNLSVCLSVCLPWWLVGCWVEVPVTSGSVCNQSTLGDCSLIHMPLL